MLTTINYGFWEFWEYNQTEGYYGSQKCIFDGVNRLIYVSPDVTDLSIRQDVYSDWKEWVQVRNNATYAEAIRPVGGDPIDVDAGIYAGDLYFLKNNWRIVVDLNKVRIAGVLYSDNFDTAYVDSDLNPIYPATVSSVVNTIATSNTTGLVDAVWAYPTRELTQQVTVDYDGIADAVWDKLLDDMVTANSAGERFKALLTLNQYLGLK